MSFKSVYFNSDHTRHFSIFKVLPKYLQNLLLYIPFLQGSDFYFTVTMTDDLCPDTDDYHLSDQVLLL